MLYYFLSFIRWDVDPNIFILPIVHHPIRWYAVFWLLGIILSYGVLLKILKSENKSAELLDKLAGYILLGTIIGARLGHVLFYDPSYYFSNPAKILAVWEGGLASHGGGIGLLTAMYLFSKKTNLDFLWIADRLAIVVPLAGCCIRLGNLMNSEMIGKPTDVPWAFIFEKIDPIPRHPAQLYEAIYCLFLFVLLYGLWRYSSIKRIQGNSFALLLILLFIFRFVDEYFKINQEAFEDSLPINMGQILSIPFILGGIALLVYNSKRKKSVAKRRLS
ncbi:prolipoprotein diacylglyceryl transferase [Sphingobacterium oryzagri]|uniref:Phosphatidylglycerol--prolipoprotein diacylglyceryl transferase n=1 Tax=Sphingobacterium oryzagri TaxID=3025669 RepID=A0ABY7WDQ2_9SPHI|nr:prolipoprotein diacylglyceryl transferase [Sphingobacterium sp. KACC 22765]WDF67610.1 prolipoprotein diacylglyceryl transferase [Sphingobacterium sp. KACC 22765]